MENSEEVYWPKGIIDKILFIDSSYIFPYGFKNLITEPPTKYGTLSVIKCMGFVSRNKHSKYYWLCLCDCGNKRVVDGSSLKSNRTFQCRICSSHRGKCHGPEYRAWVDMKRRCNNPDFQSYKNYGGRGIKIYNEWLGENGFENFYEYVGPRPSKEHSLDRYPNNDGNYEPGNVRWATSKEQADNRRTTCKLNYNGTDYSKAELAKLAGLTPMGMDFRLKNMSVTEAVETPVRKRNDCN